MKRKPEFVVYLSKFYSHSFIFSGRSGRVTKFERQQPGSHDKVTCWNSRHNAQSIIAGRRDNYIVDDIMDTPSFSSL